MNQREFILNTLIGYKNDLSTVAFDDVIETCLYLTKDGRKCAVGKHLKEGPWQTYSGTVGFLDQDYSLNDILTPEAAEQRLPLMVWRQMQRYHDRLSREGRGISNADMVMLNDIVTELEEASGFRFPELRFENDPISGF